MRVHRGCWKCLGPSVPFLSGSWSIKCRVTESKYVADNFCWAGWQVLSSSLISFLTLLVCVLNALYERRFEALLHYSTRQKHIDYTPPNTPLVLFLFAHTRSRCSCHQSSNIPQSVEEYDRSRRLESMRKDIECCYGRVKECFRLFKGDVLFKTRESINNAWCTACILHNMLHHFNKRTE